MHEELTPAPAESDAPALDEWKRELRVDFERWIESLDDIPDSEGADADEPEAPDLYSFYEQLAAATTEARKSNRRTAEAFSQWSETLSGLDDELRLLREQFARLAPPANGHRTTGIRQRSCDCAADPAGPAGHDRNLARKAERRRRAGH